MMEIKQRTKVQIIFESDELTPMEIIDYFNSHVEDQLDGDIEITDYKALDWKGRNCSEKTKEEDEK